MSDPLFWFLRAVSGGIASTFFWVLARATAVAVVFCAAALYFGSRL